MPAAGFFSIKYIAHDNKAISTSMVARQRNFINHDLIRFDLKSNVSIVISKINTKLSKIIALIAVYNNSDDQAISATTLLKKSSHSVLRSLFCIAMPQWIPEMKDAITAP